ncbi:MAG: prolipoprotein diacylglyceryl transferase family protein [Anaerolineae bacterium]
MFDQYAIIFDRLWQTYTVALLVSVILSLIWVLWRTPAPQRGRVFDVCLLALIGAVLIGRGVHVAVQWDFFADHRELIVQLDRDGGLSWHGALLGALIVGGVIARWRGVTFVPLLAHVGAMIPLLAVLSWYACATAGCAYGAEVASMADYPPMLTWMGADHYQIDAPRFATQPLAMLALCLTAPTVWYYYSRRQTRLLTFPVALMWVALIAFVVAFWRGDSSPVVGGLRVAQWLDVLVLVGCVGVIRWLNAR